MRLALHALALLLLLWPLPLAAQSASCVPSPHPTPLPSIDSILGPSGLRVLSGQLGGASDTLRFALHFRANGTLLRLLPLSGGIPDSVLRQIRANARTRVFTESWGVHVLLYPGDPRTLAFRASTFCSATPPPSTGPQYEARVMSADEARRLSLLRGPFRFVVELDTLGRVGKASMVQSSGDRTWDAQVLQRARDDRYRPATLDGAPVASRLERASDSL